MTAKSKFLFVNNNTFSGNGLSGGDRIWVELMRHWSKKNQVDLLGSEGASQMAAKYGLFANKRYISAPVVKIANPKILLNPLYLFFYIITRTTLGCITVIKNLKKLKRYRYIYSVSDFYPDLFPALLVKIFRPKTKWIAGYYLFAPSPLAKDSPYKGKDFLKGLFYWLMQRPSYWLAKSFADYVFVTSEPDVNRFITTNRTRQKIVVVRGGVDTTPSEKYFQRQKQKIISSRKYDACFMGRFHQQKGVLELIDIWREVVKLKPKAKLLMIGNGGLKRAVKEKIEKLKLGRNIRLRGFLDGDEKFRMFLKCRVVVHPAVYDSGGMAAAEAMAWGLPGVSFDLEALKTYYPQGMIKTPCFNYQKFAHNIIRLLENDKLYNKLAREAIDLINNQWSWSKRAMDILKQIKY